MAIEWYISTSKILQIIGIVIPISIGWRSTWMISNTLWNNLYHVVIQNITFKHLDARSATLFSLTLRYVSGAWGCTRDSWQSNPGVNPICAKITASKYLCVRSAYGHAHSKISNPSSQSKICAAASAAHWHCTLHHSLHSAVHSSHLSSLSQIQSVGSGSI